MADGIAVEGMRLVKGALVRAVESPNDLEARADMMAAAAMGATAFQKGLGGMHALAHPIGALFDTHHGMTNAVLMPYVLAFNRDAIAEKMQRLSAWLGLVDSGSHGAGFDAFQRFVLDLRARIGVPHTLAELGVEDEERIALLADMAAVDPSAAGNPRSFDRAAAAEVLDNALKGKL